MSPAACHPRNLYSASMTGSLPARRPAGLRALRDHGADDGGRDRPADHLARHAVLQGRRPARSTSRRASATRRRPTTRRATRTCRCCSPIRPAPGSRTRAPCSCRAPPRSTTTNLESNRSATAARAARSCPQRRACTLPPSSGPVGLVLPAPLHLRAPGAGVRLAGRRLLRGADAVRRAHGRGAHAPLGGAGGSPSRQPEGGVARLGRPHGRAGPPPHNGCAVGRRPRRLSRCRAASQSSPTAPPVACGSATCPNGCRRRRPESA